MRTYLVMKKNENLGGIKLELDEEFELKLLKQRNHNNSSSKRKKAKRVKWKMIPLHSYLYPSKRMLREKRRGAPIPSQPSIKSKGCD
jgi:hypothetical protein